MSTASVTDQVERERVERAYRLAWPDEPGVLDVSEPEEAWAEAIGRIADTHSALDWTILALALLDEGGGTLGRWEVRSGPAPALSFACGDTWAHHIIGYPKQWASKHATGAYTDGTAQELLLLMAAADELARREVQP